MIVLGTITDLRKESNHQQQQIDVKSLRRIQLQNENVIQMIVNVIIFANCLIFLMRTKTNCTRESERERERLGTVSIIF